MSKDITIDLMNAMFSVFRLIKGQMGSHGLTQLSMLQIQTLFFLNHRGNATMSDVSDNFHIELSSATSLMNKLFDQKLVNRNEDPNDRRLVRVALTSKGKELLEKAMKDRKKAMTKILSYLSLKEKEQLLNILNTLRDNVQKHE